MSINHLINNPTPININTNLINSDFIAVSRRRARLPNYPQADRDLLPNRVQVIQPHSDVAKLPTFEHDGLNG